MRSKGQISNVHERFTSQANSWDVRRCAAARGELRCLGLKIALANHRDFKLPRLFQGVNCET
jgi:hypothetical protein